MQDYIKTLQSLPKARIQDLLQRRYSRSVIVSNFLTVMVWFYIPTFLMVWTLGQNGCILLSYGILMWHLSSQPHQLGYSLCSFPTTNYYKCQLKIGSGWKGLENSIHLCLLITSVQPKFTEELITTFYLNMGTCKTNSIRGTQMHPWQFSTESRSARAIYTV